MFMVFWDDEAGICLPMGKDTQCEGAIATACDAPVVFNSRDEANKAIKISRLFAQLQLARGESVNDEFLSGYKNVKIRKVEQA